MKILVITPHPDDFIIGAGGTLLNHFEKGDEIYVFYLFKSVCTKEEIETIGQKGFRIIHPNRTYNLDNESVFDVMQMIRETKPEIVMTHVDGAHLEHTITANITKMACELSSNKTIKSKYEPHPVRDVVFFEGIDGSLTNLGMNTLSFIDITEKIDEKINMLNKFKSIIGPMVDIQEIIRNLGRLRGQQSDAKYAELFQIINIKNDAQLIRENIGDFAIYDYEKNSEKFLA